MRTKKIITIAILAIIISYTCNHIQSQSLTQYKIQKIKDSKYMHDTSVRKLHHYGDVFSAKHDSHAHFKTFDKNRIKAKRWGIATIGLIAATAALEYRSRSGDYFEGGYLGGALITATLSCVTGSLGVIFKIKSNKAKEKALTIFNTTANMESKNTINSNASLIIKHDAVGLSFAF